VPGIGLLLCLFFTNTFFINTVRAETSVQVIALFNDKAMLSIDGKRAKVVKAGDSLHGVRLIESNTKQATVEIAGKTQVLNLQSGLVLSGSLGTSAPQSSLDSVQLWADSSGFFRAKGAINGRSTEFLVDTGANIVVFSSRDADRLGIEYDRGVKSFATTASGTAPMYVIRAERINVAGIQLNDIRTGIIVGSFPVVPLLGMTFLEKVDMNRSGNLMELKKRY